MLEAKCEIPEMAASCQPCGESQSLCHLRRIGVRTPVPSIPDLIHFPNTVTLIGRNREVVNCFFSSTPSHRGNYISRIHARVIRNADAYVLVDCSLTGVYVNDIRIHDRVELQEGDTVTFGHPDGRKIIEGARVRQPNSPFYFLFEHCHCSPSQMLRPRDERRILPQELRTLACTEVFPPAEVRLGLVRSAALPWVAHGSPSGAGDAHYGPQSPAATTSTPPQMAAVADTSSVPPNSFSVSSSSPQVTGQIRPAASTFFSREDACRPVSWPRRSTSPDYTVLGKGSFVSPDSSPQRPVEIADNISSQKSLDSDNSELLSDRSWSPAECEPNSDKLVQDENGKSALGPPCVGAGASDGGDFQSERPRKPDRDSQQALPFLQAEERDSTDSRLSDSNLEELVVGNSDQDEETMEENICQGTEETAGAGLQVQKAKTVTKQIMEEQEEDVWAAERRSAGGTEEEEPSEEDGGSSKERSLCEASLLETAEAGNVRNCLPERIHALSSGKSGNDALDSANRTSGDCPLGKEPEKDSPAELVGQERLDPDGTRATSLPGSLSFEVQRGSSDNEMNSGERVSCGESAMEMEPCPHASLLIQHKGHFGAGDTGFLEPEMSSVSPETAGASFVETSCADVGIQARCLEEEDAEAAEEGDAHTTPGVLVHDRLRMGSASSDVSAVGFLADEPPSGESFRGRERESCGLAPEDVTSENLPETSKEEEAVVVPSSPALSVVLKELVVEEPLEAPAPEEPGDVKFSDERLSQISETSSNRKEEEALVAGRKLENTTPSPVQAERVLQNCVAEPMEEDETGAHGNECPLLGTASALVDGLPKRGEHGSDSGRKFQEEPDNEGGGGSAVEKGISSTAAVSGKDGDSQEQIAGGRGLERAWGVAGGGWQEGAGCALTESSLGGGLEEDGSQPSEDSASGTRARECSPSCDHGEGGILEFSSESDKREGGERLVLESSRGLPSQGLTEAERDLSLNDDSVMELEVHDAHEKTLADVSSDEAKADCKQNSTQAVGPLSIGHACSGMSSGSCASLVCRQESPVSSGPQESKSCRAEGLEDGVEAEACQTSAENLPLEDSSVGGNAQEESCEPDVAVEHLTPFGPEGGNKEAPLSAEEEDGSFLQGLKSSQPREGKGSLLVDAPGVDFEKFRDAEAGSIPRDPSTGSSKVPSELFRDDKLPVCSSDSEREKESDGSACLSVTTTTGIPLQRRESLPLAPAVDLCTVAKKNSELCEEQVLGSPLPGPCDKAVQEASVGSWEGTVVSNEGLEQQNCSRHESNSSPDNTSVTLPETHGTEMAVGGDLSPSAKHAVVGEELEDQDTERTHLVPADLRNIFAEPSCLSENDVKLGTEEQVPDSAGRLAEDTGLVLAQNDWISSQPDMKILAGSLEDQEAVKEHSGSDVPASLCSGKKEYDQKNGVRAPGEQHEVKMLQCQGDTGQAGERLDSPGGHGENLDCLEDQRAFSQKKEESKGSSSRKRRLDEDREGLRLSGLEGDSCSEKRICPLDFSSAQGAPPDSPALTATIPPSPPPLKEERHDQVGRTIGKFLNQYRTQITLHSKEAEQRNRDRVAQIVRNYFKYSSCKPAAGNENGGAWPPLLAEAAEDTDLMSVSILEAGKKGNGDELTPPEDQVEALQLRPSSPKSHTVTSGATSSQSCSPLQEQGEDLGSPLPESVWEAYFSEEEDFQLQVCSQLNNPPPGSPSRSPHAERVAGSTEKDLDFLFSDGSNSSVEPDVCKPPIKPHERDPFRVGEDGSPEGPSDMAGKAAEVNMASQFYCEASDEGWGDEDPGTPSDTLASPQEPSCAQPDPHVSVAPEERDAVALRLADAVSDGGDGGEAPRREELQQATPPPVNSTAAEEEEDDGPCGSQTEDAAFPERSHTDLPCPDRECEPAIGRPSASSPWESSPTPHVLGCSRAPLKREPSDEGQGWQNDGGQGPPSLFPTVSGAAAAAAFERSSCPAAGGIKEEFSPPESSSATCPGPTQDKLTLLHNGSCLLSFSAVRGGSVEAAGGDDGDDGGGSESTRSEKEQPSLFLLPSSEAGSPADTATYVKDKDFRGHLAKDASRKGSVAGLPGQVGSRNASQGAPEEMGTLSGTGAFDEQVLLCSPREGVPSLTQDSLAVVPSASQSFKEEKGWITSSSLGAPCPLACSPVISVLLQPHMPEALADRQKESSGSPVDLGSRDGLLLPYQKEEEAEVAGALESEPVNSDSDCAAGLASPDSEEGVSSTSSGRPRAASLPQAQSSPWPGANGSERSSVLKGWASSQQDVEFQLQECQSVLAEVSKSLSRAEGIDSAHMEKWRDQIALLQKATKMPQTHIAVVGNTGAGKSCLLNALLDEEGVLPTSNMRACTAVVVEVSRAARGSPYEADVEFLSREEWYKELWALLEDMKDKSGNLRRRCPDRKTEAGAAYCRVKAVYGRIEEFEKLEQMQEVTQYLGTVKHLSAETAAVFRSNIEKFIDSQTDNLREMKGGEFWPIVKCVRIRVANSEVLKTGVVLVDLPGTRDSNAARDEAAKEYLKNCNAVWVVASITRAVDDKTAKEMLSASLRRQLLMDGQYGSLAFVCTKTDSFNITEIVKDLKLQGEIQSLEDELRDLENQRMRAEVEKRNLYELLLQEEQRRQASGADSAWLQRQHDILEKEFSINDLQRQKETKLRAISLLCVLARNKFSKQQILTDFSAGLEEMTRKALDPECEEDSDEDMEEGDDADSGSAGLGEAESQPMRLQVFTVSSTEYLKLCGKLLRDGPPQVFHDTKDTEIPALKKLAIDTALKHSMVATEKVIRDVARVLSQMVNYLTSQRAEDNSHQAQIQAVVQRFLQDVPSHLQCPVERSVRDVQHCFGVLIRDGFQKGATRAKERCEAIVRSWGSPFKGFPHATYHAVCCRHGVYTSPKYGGVDFNGDLAQPIYEAVSVVWNEVFNFKLLESVDGFNKTVLVELRSIFKDLERKLREHSRITAVVRTIAWQQMEATRAKLINFTLDLMNYITNRQREISRLVTPEIKSRMEPAYTACSQMSGHGYFQEMRAKMENYIHREKDAIFDSVTRKVQEQLGQLQEHIQEKFQRLVRELTRSLKMQFEPVLKPVQKNGKIIPELMNICTKVDKLCRRSCVDYILPCSVLPADGSSGTDEGQPPVSSAENREISPAASVPVRLPEATVAMQQPPLPLPLAGRKRVGEAIHPQLEKKYKGQATAPGAGGDFAGHPSQCGMADVKLEPCTQDPGSLSQPSTSQAPAPEDCRQKADLVLDTSETPHVAMKLSGFAIPGSSGVLHVQAAEGIGGLCSDLNVEGKQSVKAEKMPLGREISSSDCSWMTH